MDEAYREKGKEVRDNAVKKRDELEQEGTGDRFMEMQPRRPPPLDASMVGRRIEFCYRYEDEEADGDGFSFHWLSGKVDAVFSAKSKKNFANIRWDDALLEEGENPVSKEKLLPSFWNTTRHGGWVHFLKKH